ncbi:MAG: hypothetical protein QM785_05110 [Pyrinomonadaceae bacterium]
MRYFALIVFSIAAFATAGFAKAPETISVRMGQSKTSDHGKVSVKFVSIVEDSRCPMNARCVWAGNAKIKLAVSKGKAAARSIELNSGLKPDSVVVYGYEIKFVDLSPYPGEKVRMVAMPKMATISVKKAK